jgi:hypothetical protein
LPRPAPASLNYSQQSSGQIGVGQNSLANAFKAKLDRLYARYSGPTQLSFEYGDDEDEAAN